MLAGNLYFSKARLYEDGFGYRDAVANYGTAGEYYLAAGDTARYVRACMKAAKCCLALNDAAMAESFLSGMEPYADCVKDSDKVRYIRLMSRTDDDMSREDVLRLINESVSDYDQLDPSNMLSISDVYLLAGYRDSAGAYLNRYKLMDPDYSRNPMFYLRLSNLYDSLGQDNMAFDAYRRLVFLKDSVYMDRLRENVRLVERRIDEQVRVYRTGTVWAWLVAALSMAAVASTFLLFRFRRKFLTQRHRAEHLEDMYRSVAADKEALSNMVRNSVLIDEPTRKVLENRLSVLDELLTVRLLDKGRYSPEKASEMLESIALDKDAYLNSLGLMFSVRHPSVADWMRSHQMSLWEIGYCSLYCMGYKGKEIGSILNSSRYYKINSSIRKKLGLSPNETNLDIYLRNLMASVEPDPAR